VRTDDDDVKTKEMEAGPKASYGYGGKFGVQKDRMDKVLDSILSVWLFKWHNENSTCENKHIA